jgi:thioredoxin 2
VAIDLKGIATLPVNVWRFLSSIAAEGLHDPVCGKIASAKLGGSLPVLREGPTCRRENRVPASRLADTGRCGACKSSLPPVEEPTDVNPEIFDEIVQHARVPILVDFWAAWCGPCRIAAPEVARTAKELAGEAIVLKVDTEAYPELAVRFNVRGIPNFAIFSKGRLVRQQAGLVNHEQLEAWLSEARTMPIR